MFNFSHPEHLDDLLPPLAATIARCREQALVWLATHDYHLVMPPLADYIETLTGGDEDLDLQTFKITDTLSGRTLGIRADQTPQIARLDAHLTDKPAVRRYCYCGSTLRTLPLQRGQGRESLQLGAELIGAPSGRGDWEMASLALGALVAMGVTDACIDLGHAGLFADSTAALSPAVRRQLIALVEQRDIAALQRLIAQEHLQVATGEALRMLVQNTGDAAALTHAASALPAPALATLNYVWQQLRAEGYNTGINLSDLGSYGYHSGMVFCIYAHNRLIARGGRYQQHGGDDGVGFSIDLRALCDLMTPAVATVVVNVPLNEQDEAWRAAVATLRAARRPLRFVYEDNPLALPALQKQQNKWIVKEHE